MLAKSTENKTHVVINQIFSSSLFLFRLLFPCSKADTFTPSDGIFESVSCFMVLGKVFRVRNKAVMLGERDERVER